MDGIDKKVENICLFDLDGTMADFDLAMRTSLEKMEAPGADPGGDHCPAAPFRGGREALLPAGKGEAAGHRQALSENGQDLGIKLLLRQKESWSTPCKGQDDHLGWLQRNPLRV